METDTAPNSSNLPEVLQPAVSLWFEKFAEHDIVLPDEIATSVSRLVACSEFAAKVVLREAQWFANNVASFSSPAVDAGLDNFVLKIASSDADAALVKSELRRYRNRSLLRILWREIQGQADLDETLQQLSLLADRLLDAAMRYAEKKLMSRFGRVRSATGEVVPMVVLGMGKLGGRELNFSSDIDIIFCFTEDGQTDGARTQSAQEYFTRLSRQVIALLDEVTVDGFVFRVDTRLRPFGDSGPPVVSFAALESYLLKHGRDWERYAYVKARVVGTQPPEEIAAELNDNMIRPFVYRRYLDYGVFESVREMQDMITAEVRRRELQDNVKLGPGGIREAEFIVQALQLVRGGSEPQLQGCEFQKVLPLLVSERGISQPDADEILNSYRYLRRLENFIQAIRDEQTHELPANDIDRARLCLATRSESWDALIVELDRHRHAISAQFNAVAFRGRSDENPKWQVFGRLWNTSASASDWSKALDSKFADELATEIVAFASSSAVQQVDSVSVDDYSASFPF